MPRSLSAKSTPDVLKQDAKRWFKSLQAGDATARQRLTDGWPTAPTDLTLRDVQHALAREYGFADWKALLAALDDIALDRQSHAERIDALLRHGWGGDRALAQRLLARDPALARHSIFTAAACGDVETVRALLASDPALATATGGPHGWTALAFVCYSRLDAEQAVTIATLLLDAGADPRFAFDDGWGNPFTCITGAIGLGEGVKPTHPQADALVALLLARGADPFDTQALYNDSIAYDRVHWLETLWTACAAAGRTAEWQQVEGRGLGGRIKVGTLNYLLGNAVTNRHHDRAAWLLAHGADARTRHSYSAQPVHTVARLAGDTAMVTLLEAHGAQPEALRGPHALVAALVADDEPTVQALLAADPSLVRQPLLPIVAGHQHARAVTRLLDAGADINGRDGEGATALHRAAHANALEVIEVLLARGATVDLRDPRWQGTPLGWSVATGRHAAAERLARVSRDVRALVRSGRVTRLAEVLHAEPALANASLREVSDPTPLFCVPDEESVAMELATVLLAHGADRTVRNAQGQTAADVARTRGLDDVAALLAV
ncbi:MAG: ankyrin repeat domain-containing protein [Gemmatimonadaceae bacterium]|nr:ankyrin repeat domain-containing protein [Gemmatimonadaceae bacterium]